MTVRFMFAQPETEQIRFEPYLIDDTFFRDSTNLPVLTLNGCIKRALKHNITIKSMEADLAASQARRDEGYSSFMPSLSTNLGWQRYDREMLRIRNDEIITSRDSYSASLSASQNLFNGGYDWFQMKYNTLSFGQQILSREQTKSELIYSIKSIYYAIIAADRMVKVAKLSVSRATDQLNLVEEQFKLGSASQSDVAKIRILQADGKLRQVQAENALRENREELNALLFFPLDSIYKLENEMSMPQILMPLDYYIELAMDSSLEIQSMQKASKMYKLSKSMVKSTYYPSVSLSLYYSWSDIELPDRWDDWNDNDSWTLSLNFSWALFSGLSRFYSLKESQAYLLKSNIELEETELSIRKQVRQSYGKINEAIQRIELAKVKLEDAKLTADINTEKYKLGSATLLEMLDSEVSLVESETEYIQALYDYKINVVTIEKLCGR
ncbi:TolC family protein [bacterium]|nr:TolC family protein [bacterium]